MALYICSMYKYIVILMLAFQLAACKLQPVKTQLAGLGAGAGAGSSAGAGAGLGGGMKRWFGIFKKWTRPPQTTTWRPETTTRRPETTTRRPETTTRRPETTTRRPETTTWRPETMFTSEQKESEETIAADEPQTTLENDLRCTTKRPLPILLKQPCLETDNGEQLQAFAGEEDTGSTDGDGTIEKSTLTSLQYAGPTTREPPNLFMDDI